MSKLGDHSIWMRRMIIIGFIWAAIALISATIIEPTAENLTLFFSITVSGLYTAILYTTRRMWLPLLLKVPLRNAMLLGIANAAFIEAVFLLFEKICQAEGIAAHPNLFIDWIMTMPWYAMMVITFVRAHQRQRFSPWIVLILGGLYEMGADGVVAQIVALPFGDSQLLDPLYWLMLVTVYFWVFIIIYSSIVLPPALLISQTPHPEEPPGSSRLRDALRPLSWLIPFTIYLIILIMIIGALSP